MPVETPRDRGDSRESFDTRLAQARASLTNPEMTRTIEDHEGQRVLVLRTDSPIIRDLVRNSDDGGRSADFITVEPPIADQPTHLR